jgi:iron complex transport system substrate-binding protein
MRVVSLLPAATEIVAALGAERELVGVSHECDHPPSVRSHLRVTSAAIASHRSSSEIDREVRERSEAGGSLFAIDDAAIAATHPDVLLTQALCEVCAVSEHDVRAIASRLSPSPDVVTLGGATLDGVFEDIRRVASALGRRDEAEALLASFDQRIRLVHERLAAARAPRPRVATIEWTDPVFLAGHWTPEIIRRAGGTDALVRAGEHSRNATVAEIEAAGPELLIVAPCGFELTRALDEADALLRQQEWRWAHSLPVWVLDGNALLSRPGPRLVDAVEVLASVMHPNLFGTPADGYARAIQRS